MAKAHSPGLGAEIRRRLGPSPPGALPRLSIVVPNRDGASHLRRLIAGLSGCTEYPDFELIVVDNASSDGSLTFLREVEAPFPIAILANAHNESFSDACNMGAEAARSDLLLFLNNDVEPLEPGWLRELVHCGIAHEAGIAGATLVLAEAGEGGEPRVQHRQIWIAERDDGLLGPDRSSFGEELFGAGFGEDSFSPVPSGACMLIEAGLFRQVGGFTHGYLYGGEDIDLGLKVAAAGRRVVCSGRSVLLHRLGATRAREDDRLRHAREAGNRRLFWETWGSTLRREYELDRLAGGGRWAAPCTPVDSPEAREGALALSFCLKSQGPALTPPAVDPMEALVEELDRRGRRCAALWQGADELHGLEYDVVVHLHGPARHVPVPGRLNALWVSGPADRAPALEADRYDLVLKGPLEADELIAAAEARAAELALPLRIEPEPA